jgi:hypothetical protein
MGHRFAVDGQTVDVLASDGLRRPPRTDGQFKTIEVPGGSQAIGRSEAVTMLIDGEPVIVRRPTLLGAILLKARSLRVHRRPEDQRQDLILLLGLMVDPRAASLTMSRSERRWLRVARAAYARLIA